MHIKGLLLQVSLSGFICHVLTVFLDGHEDLFLNSTECSKVKTMTRTWQGPPEREHLQVRALLCSILIA